MMIMMMTTHLVKNICSKNFYIYINEISNTNITIINIQVSPYKRFPDAYEKKRNVPHISSKDLILSGLVQFAINMEPNQLIRFQDFDTKPNQTTLKLKPNHKLRLGFCLHILVYFVFILLDCL